MMGQETGQRSSLTVNHGTYYVDTTVGKDRQLACTGAPCVINLFKKNETYYLFLIFARDTTEQIYRFYVGKETGFRVRDRPDARPTPGRGLSRETGSLERVPRIS